jgi:nucleotide-binding universal stress UspA family protein
LPGEFEEEAESANENYQERKKEVEEVARQHGITVICDTCRGHAAKALLKYADEGDYDLIVLGHSDYSELWGRLLGDTADRISDHAHCSVLIVKTPAVSSADDSTPTRPLG